MVTYTKDPDSNLDYKVDWTAWLGSDTITASVWTVPAALTKSNESNTDTVSTVFIAGGKKGNKYVVTNRITTVNGRIDDRTFELEIVEK